jgi:hypothetical protein
MWIIKGVGLGLFLFVAFVVFRFVANMRFSKANAIGLSAVYGLTVGSYVFWLALLCCIGLGICVLGSWPVRVQH